MTKKSNKIHGYTVSGGAQEEGSDNRPLRTTRFLQPEEKQTPMGFALSMGEAMQKKDDQSKIQKAKEKQVEERPGDAMEPSSSSQASPWLPSDWSPYSPWTAFADTNEMYWSSLSTSFPTPSSCSVWSQPNWLPQYGYLHDTVTHTEMENCEARFQHWVHSEANNFLIGADDKRQGRQGGRLQMLKIKSSARHLALPTIPRDLQQIFQYEDILCDFACFSSHRMLQKVLVLVPNRLKISIIHSLTRQADRLIYHCNGCFVAGQIVFEALMAQDKARVGDLSWSVVEIVDAALHFMNEAHDGDVMGNLSNNRVAITIFDKHGNYSLRSWIELLAKVQNFVSADLRSELFETAHCFRWNQLNCILKVVSLDFHNIVTNVYGIRTVTGILEFVARSDNPNLCEEQNALVKIILDQVVGKGLRDYIVHEFANYAVSYAIPVRFWEIFVCIVSNLVVFLRDPHGNYVVQRCIDSKKCMDDHHGQIPILTLAESLIKQEADLCEVEYYAAVKLKVLTELRQLYSKPRLTSEIKRMISNLV